MHTARMWQGPYWTSSLSASQVCWPAGSVASLLMIQECISPFSQRSRNLSISAPKTPAQQRLKVRTCGRLAGSWPLRCGSPVLAAPLLSPSPLLPTPPRVRPGDTQQPAMHLPEFIYESNIFFFYERDMFAGKYDSLHFMSPLISNPSLPRGFL